MSFKQIVSLIEKRKNKKTLFLCQPHNKGDCFELCVLYTRSNLFETRQMGRVVQHQNGKPLARLIKMCCKSSNTYCNTYIKLTAATAAPLWRCQKIYLFTEKWTKSALNKKVCFLRFPTLINFLLLTVTYRPYLIFKASSLWADSFYKSICPSVCLSVCVFTLEVSFKHLFSPTSQSRMSNIFRDSESLGKNKGNKWSQMRIFLFGSGLKSPQKMADFALQNMVETTLHNGLETSGQYEYR